MLRSKAAPLTARLLSSFFANDARTPSFLIDGVFLQVCEELNETPSHTSEYALSDPAGSAVANPSN